MTLLDTLVKWDFYQIKLVIDKSINANNYIDPKWFGVAYVVGQTGGVLITQDYGLTWQPVSIDLPSNLNSLSYITSEAALIVGENATVLQTFSAGQFYDKVNIDVNLTSNREFTDVLIYNSNSAIVIGKGGLIFHLTLDNVTLRWNVSNNVLNDQTLVTVTQADLESVIKNISSIVYKDYQSN